MSTFTGILRSSWLLNEYKGICSALDINISMSVYGKYINWRTLYESKILGLLHEVMELFLGEGQGSARLHPVGHGRSCNIYHYKSCQFINFKET